MGFVAKEGVAATPSFDPVSTLRDFIFRLVPQKVGLF